MNTNRRVDYSRIGAFTLIELLTVIVIIALLVAISFPIAKSAKRSAQATDCTTRLRQIGNALEIYYADASGYPTKLEHLVRSNIITDERILLCPTDIWSGYASKVDECHSKRAEERVSYESIVSWPQEMRDQLFDLDPNPGIVACRLHGQATSSFEWGARDFCGSAWHLYEGMLLRLRRDGSVERATLTLKTSPLGRQFLLWWLFTDIPHPTGTPDPPTGR